MDISCQGTTEMIYDLSKDSEWFKQRISAVAFLGPVAKLGNCSSGILKILANLPAVISLAKTLHIYEWFPENYLQKTAFTIICGTFPQICELGVGLIADDDPKLND